MIRAVSDKDIFLSLFKVIGPRGQETRFEVVVFTADLIFSAWVDVLPAVQKTSNIPQSPRSSCQSDSRTAVSSVTLLELDIFGEDTDEGQDTVGFEVTIDGHDPVPALLLNIGKVDAWDNR